MASHCIAFERAGGGEKGLLCYCALCLCLGFHSIDVGFSDYHALRGRAKMFPAACAVWNGGVGK